MTTTKTNKSIILTGVKSVNSNFNADFDMQPKEFPSPFALKYALKSYWNEIGENVFSMKSFYNEKDKLKVKTFERRFIEKFGEIKTKSKFELMLALYNCIDTKNFGFINTLKDVSHGEKGIVQVSYGKNAYKDTLVNDLEIISQFASGDNKDMSTIGSKSTVDFALYNYSILVNPQSISTLFEEKYQELGLEKYSEEDYRKLIDAIKYGVANLNSVSKMGSTTSYVVQIDLKEGQVFKSVDFTSLVKVTLNEEKVAVIDFSKVTEFINDNLDNIEDYKLYADKYSQEIVGWEKEVLGL